MSQDLLRLEDVTKYYSGNGSVGLGIHKVNLTFNLGEFVVITGASGSGKTTLLNVITGMDTYEEGAIYLNGEDTTYYGKSEYEEFRRKYISFIFQNYNLIDSFTVYQNVELSLIARGIPKKDRKKQVLEILEKVGLKDRVKHRVTKLSGGEKQRVSIARALISDAPIIACDEITGNLDSETSLEIIELLKKLSSDKLVLLVSHDINEAIDHATRVVIMHDGSVDKDYNINQNKEKEEVVRHERKFEQVSIKDTFGLSTRLLLSTPSKFILLFFIVTFFSMFLLIGAMSYNYMDKVALKITKIETSADKSDFDNRIIVKKVDDSVFTLSDIEKIEKIKYVSSIVKNDIFFDNKVYYAFDEKVEDKDFESAILPVSTLESRDLMLGRLPKNANEVVIVGNRKLLNETVYYSFDGDLKVREAKVVGLLPTTSEKTFYIHNDIYDEIVEKFEMNQVFLHYTKESNNKAFMMLSQKYDWYVDETLTDDQIVVSTHTTRIDDSNEPYEDVFNYHWSFEFILNGKKLQFLEKDLIYKKYVYDRQEDTYLKGKEKLEAICSAKKLNSRKGYLSPNNYQKLKEFLQVDYQITVLADKDDYVESVVTEIEKMEYFCSAKSLVENKETLMIAEGLKIAVILIESVLVVGIIFVMYVVIRNILNSQQKSFLIMRSLGIDGNRISLQVYTELLFMLLINFVIILLLWIIFKNRNFGGFFSSIHQSSILMLALIYAIAIFVFAFIGFKYSNSVIKSSIVNKEME